MVDRLYAEVTLVIVNTLVPLTLVKTISSSLALNL